MKYWKQNVTHVEGLGCDSTPNNNQNIQFHNESWITVAYIFFLFRNLVIYKQRSLDLIIKTFSSCLYKWNIERSLCGIYRGSEWINRSVVSTVQDVTCSAWIKRNKGNPILEMSSRTHPPQKNKGQLTFESPKDIPLYLRLF